MDCEEVLSGRAETGRGRTIEGMLGKDSSPAHADLCIPAMRSGRRDNDIHPYACEVCIAYNCEHHLYTGAR